tara:strand:+ start:1258 stop:1530 length:273 start_codon:yes stop_codon:yes gene_type:complete
MSDIKNKINFFEKLVDNNKLDLLKINKSIKNNTNCVKKKVTHWNKIRKKVLTESDINYNDSLNKNTKINTNTNNNSDDEESLLNENSIIN